MTLLAVMRHAPTAWNETGRLQGRADPTLSATGRAAVRRWRLPAPVKDMVWWTSPLRRAIETADGLEIAAEREPALIEMDWGRWQGSTLAALRAADPPGMAWAEAQGLDLMPPGGESPRQVQARLQPWLKRVADGGQPAACISHKGVLRALLAAATGWDMRGPPPIMLRPATIHLFTLASAGEPSLLKANLALEP